MSLKPRAEGGSAVEWTKSSYSAANSNDCVEVANRTCDEAILVRDSKDPEGPHLTVTRVAWSEFVAFAAASTV